jgi:hypothetical protein
MIGLTFFLQDNQKDPNRCEILLESYCDYTSSGPEAEIAERLVVAALKTMRLEQSVCVVREGSRNTVKGKLKLYDAEATKRNSLKEIFQWLRQMSPE